MSSIVLLARQSRVGSVNRMEMCWSCLYLFGMMFVWCEERKK
jgi:hypothetical protein